VGGCLVPASEIYGSFRWVTRNVTKGQKKNRAGGLFSYGSDAIVNSSLKQIPTVFRSFPHGVGGVWLINVASGARRLERSTRALDQPISTKPNTSIH